MELIGAQDLDQRTLDGLAAEVAQEQAEGVALATDAAARAVSAARWDVVIGLMAMGSIVAAVVAAFILAL